MKLSALLIAAALAVPAVAAADVHTYTRVNEVTVQRDRNNSDYAVVTIDGLDAGGARTFEYRAYDYLRSGSGPTMGLAELCYRDAMLALSKPGRYHLKVTISGSGSNGQGNLVSCSLRRVEPEAGQ